MYISFRSRHHNTTYMLFLYTTIYSSTYYPTPTLKCMGYSLLTPVYITLN